MKGNVKIFNNNFEYDFLSGWLKYTRLQKGFTQEALAYGICSPSHLSYFENGKKKLRGNIIEALLKKLGIHKIKQIHSIGDIRKNFYNMMFQIESNNNEEAKTIYKEIISMENIIFSSPYSIEYKIYDLMYKTFIQKKSYNDLKSDISSLDKIYSTLNGELKYIYMFVSGRTIYKHLDHSKGLDRLKKAHTIKETPWINYHLGFSYCFNDEPLKGTYYLEKALKSYEESGRYINALWCHNNLGICYSYLKIYEKAEKHYKAALNGGKHFSVEKIFWHLYTNLSHLYFHNGEYKESIKWSKLALEISKDPCLPAYNYASGCLEIGAFKECIRIFDKYLVDEYKNSKYYNMLYFLYLMIYHFEDDLFYKEVTEKILPFYEKIHYIEIYTEIKLKLALHLERRRRYKEANKIYKSLI